MDVTKEVDSGNGHRCGHERPCTCPEFLYSLDVNQLENLRIEFGRVIVSYQALLIPRYVPGCTFDNVVLTNFSRWRKKKEARFKVAKVNAVLEKKFGIVVV